VYLILRHDDLEDIKHKDDTEIQGMNMFDVFYNLHIFDFYWQPSCPIEFPIASAGLGLLAGEPARLASPE